MLDLYINFCDKTPEVMVLDCDVLGMRLNLWSNCECNHQLIVFVYHNWFLENTAQNLQSVSLKFEYELNIPHKTTKKVKYPSWINKVPHITPL